MKIVHPIIFILAVVIFTPLAAHAGFGVTPPYVTNQSLTRNSIYEQTIYLTRNDPTVDLKATVSIDVPGVNNWFEIVGGNEFILPKGEHKIPMVVRITVPDNAKFQQYTGNIRVKTGATDDQIKTGAVNISLGVQIDVDVTVIDKIIKDFKVRRIGVSDLNAGHKLAWLYFPGKINFEMLLENLGNVDVAPSEVRFRIYEKTGNVLLEETSNIGKMKTVSPFKTDKVIAEIPTRLPPGSYIGRFEVFNGDEVKLDGEVTISILPYGTLQAAGFGFNGLSLQHKLSVIVPIAFVLITIALILARFSQTRKIKLRKDGH